jgi:hypothetical protein
MSNLSGGMSYDEAMEVTVTRREALNEVLEHSLEWSDFLLDCGDLPEYSGEQVLAWLGY